MACTPKFLRRRKKSLLSQYRRASAPTPRQGRVLALDELYVIARPNPPTGLPSIETRKWTDEEIEIMDQARQSILAMPDIRG